MEGIWDDSRDDSRSSGHRLDEQCATAALDKVKDQLK